jgi:hypothetical protein
MAPSRYYNTAGEQMRLAFETPLHDRDGALMARRLYPVPLIIKTTDARRMGSQIIYKSLNALRGPDVNQQHSLSHKKIIPLIVCGGAGTRLQKHHHRAEHLDRRPWRGTGHPQRFRQDCARERIDLHPHGRGTPAGKSW